MQAAGLLEDVAGNINWQAQYKCPVPANDDWASQQDTRWVGSCWWPAAFRDLAIVIQPQQLFLKHSDGLLNSASQLRVLKLNWVRGPKNAAWHSMMQAGPTLLPGFPTLSHTQAFPYHTLGKTEVVPSDCLEPISRQLPCSLKKMINKSKCTKQHFHRHSPFTERAPHQSHYCSFECEPCKCHIHSGPRRGASKCSKEF